MFHITNRFIFVFGFIAGTLLSLILHTRKSELPLEQQFKKDVGYTDWFQSKKLNKKYVPNDSLKYGNQSYLLESEFLYQRISVYCLVLVSNVNNFEAVKNTWGTGCNDVGHIMLHKKKQISPLKKKEAVNESSWVQLCWSLKSVPVTFDWVLVTSDDTFAILENLRYFVANKNSLEYLYFGYPVKFWSTVYNTRKAGYVLSKGIINLLKMSDCQNHISPINKEDFMLGNFLATFNISVMPTKDEKGLSLFHPYNLNRLLFPTDSQYNIGSIYDLKCCSRYTITFNAIEAHKMYMYHYMLYTVQIFYSGNLGNRPASKPQDKSVWQNFLKSQNLSLNITAKQYYEAWTDLIESPDSFARNMKREDYSDGDQD